MVELKVVKASDVAFVVVDGKDLAASSDQIFGHLWTGFDFVILTQTVTSLHRLYHKEDVSPAKLSLRSTGSF
jgi:hypothetical protein